MNILSVSSVVVGNIDGEFKSGDLVSRENFGNMTVTKMRKEDGSEFVLIDSACGEVVKISQG